MNDVFNTWKDIPAMADDIGKSHWAVAKWKQRGSIPSAAWPAVIKALKRKGKDIGAAELLAMHARSKRSPVAQSNNSRNAA